MLTGLIALGIFGTILLLLYAVTAAYRVFVPRGADRAVERVQRWTKPESGSNQYRDVTVTHEAIPAKDVGDGVLGATV